MGHAAALAEAHNAAKAHKGWGSFVLLADVIAPIVVGKGTEVL